LNALRDYQQDIYLKARAALKNHRAICIQLATGGGKTVIFTAMCESVFQKNKTAWIVVTRKELLKQASAHLLNWGVPHGSISAGVQESRAYKIHIVSSDTLIRRMDKIKNWPDLVIFDECHIMLDRQKMIAERLPAHTKIIGYSATTERADGRGLSELYETLIEGPSIPELTELGYLCNLRYFSPPIEGLETLKRRGTEYDEKDLEDLLNRRKIYGKVIEHYKKYGIGRQALIFCRSVKSAENMAEQFQAHGFKFYNIDGQMTDKYRFSLVDKLNAGEIDGLCGCDVFIYGVDVPRVSYGAMIRPTLSKTIYFQSVGRILRPFPGKKDALFFDHVNNLLEHQEPEYPGVPPHYVPHIEWNFYGTQKRKKKDKQINIRLCPYSDFEYCRRPSCVGCPLNPFKDKPDMRKDMVVIDTELHEKEKPVPLKDRDETDRIKIENNISEQILKYKQGYESEAVKNMLNIASECGYPPLWVYHKLADKNKRAVNVPLLAEIQRQKNYKPGWIYMQKNKIKAEMKIEGEYYRSM